MRTNRRRSPRATLAWGTLAASAVALAAPAGAQEDDWALESLGRPVQSQSIEDPVIAASESGAMAAGWVERRGLQSSVVTVAYRAPGGEWDSAVVSRPGFLRTGPQITIDARGNATVVWDRVRRRGGRVMLARVEAAHIPSDTGEPGRTQRVSGPRTAGSPDLSATDGGQERLLAWSEIAPSGRRLAFTARSTTERPRFHRKARVSNPREDAPAPVAGLADSGKAVVAWSGRRGGRLRTALRPGSGSGWQAPMAPAGARSVRGDIAIGASPENVVVVWEDAPRGNARAARVRAAQTRGRRVVPFPAPLGATTGGRARFLTLANPRLSVASDGSTLALWGRRRGGSALDITASSRTRNGPWRSVLLRPRGAGPTALIPVANDSGAAAFVYGLISGIPLGAARAGPPGAAWSPLGALGGRPTLLPFDPANAVASSSRGALAAWSARHPRGPYEVLVALWRQGTSSIDPAQVAVLARPAASGPRNIAAASTDNGLDAVLFDEGPRLRVAHRGGLAG